MTVENDLITELDSLQEDIAKLQATKGFQMLQELEERKKEIGDELRQAAIKKGNFQTKFFQFQQVKQERVDWKGLCRWLYEQGRVEDEDMMPFKEEKVIGKMVKLKKDTSMQIEV